MDSQCGCCDCRKERLKKEAEGKAAKAEAEANAACHCHACKPQSEISCEAAYLDRHDPYGRRRARWYYDDKCKCAVCVEREDKKKKDEQKKVCLVCGDGAADEGCPCGACVERRKEAKDAADKKKKEAARRCIVCGARHGDQRAPGYGDRAHANLKSAKKPAKIRRHHSSKTVVIRI